MTDYHRGRAVKSQFSFQAPSCPPSQPLKPSPQAFVCASLEYSKCIIITTQPVAAFIVISKQCGPKLLLLMHLLLCYDTKPLFNDPRVGLDLKMNGVFVQKNGSR